MNRKKRTFFRPFEPFVTLGQILAYDAATEENPTPSRLMNYVMEAIQVQQLKSVKDVAEYLELTPNQLSGAVEVVTGMKFNEIHEAWIQQRVAQLQAEHPEWKTDELARAIGYCDRSALWHILHRDTVENKRRIAKKRQAEKARWEALIKRAAQGSRNRGEK